MLILSGIILAAIGQATGQVTAPMCGPFFGWSGCPNYNNETQCCSKWGYCSEGSNRGDFCAQQALGDYYRLDKFCTTDADCQDPTNPGPYTCSKEGFTHGACALMGFSDDMDGTNPFIPIPTTTPVPTTTTPVPTTTAVPTTEDPTTDDATTDDPTTTVTPMMTTAVPTRTPDDIVSNQATASAVPTTGRSTPIRTKKQSETTTSDSMTLSTTIAMIGMALLSVFIF